MRNRISAYVLVAGATFGLSAAHAEDVAGVDADPAIAIEAVVDEAVVDEAPVDEGLVASEDEYTGGDDTGVVDEELGDPWLEDVVVDDSELVVEEEFPVDEGIGTDEEVVIDEPVDVKIDDGAGIGNVPRDEDDMIYTFDGGPVMVDDESVVEGTVDETGGPMIYYMGTAPGGVDEEVASGEETVDPVDEVVGEEEVIAEEVVEETPVDDGEIVLDDPEVVVGDGEGEAVGGDGGEVTTTGEDTGEQVDNPEIYYMTGGPLESAGGPIRTVTGSEVERDISAGGDAEQALDIGSPADVLDGNTATDADDAAARATARKAAAR